MGKIEKCELKIGTLEEVLGLLHRASDSAHRNALGMAASSETLGVVLGRMGGLRTHLHGEIESGELAADAREPVERYLALAVGIVGSTRNAIEREVVTAGGFAEGLRKAADLVEHHKAREDRKLIAAKRKSAEREEKDRCDDASVSPQSEQHQAESSKQPATSPQVPGSATEPEQEPEQEPCDHCGVLISVDTGGEYCSGCVSYRNRYAKLPPPHVLEQRAARRSASG